MPPPGTTHLMYITDISAFYVPTGKVTYRMTYNQSPLSVFAVVSITLSGVFLLTFSSIIAVTG